MSAPTKFPKQTHSRQTAQTLAQWEHIVICMQLWDIVTVSSYYAGGVWQVRLAAVVLV